MCVWRCAVAVCVTVPHPILHPMAACASCQLPGASCLVPGCTGRGTRGVVAMLGREERSKEPDGAACLVTYCRSHAGHACIDQPWDIVWMLASIVALYAPPHTPTNTHTHATLQPPTHHRRAPTHLRIFHFVCTGVRGKLAILPPGVPWPVGRGSVISSLLPLPHHCATVITLFGSVPS